MYAQNSILCQFGPRNLSSVQQLISQPFLIHFWWELYHPEPPSIPPVREHVIDVLMKLPSTTAEGQNMRSWVTFHSLTSLEDFLMWELDTLQYDPITVCFPSGDTTSPNSLVSLKPNSIRHLIMLRKYIHHLVQDSHISVSSDASDHALEPDNFLHTTFHQYMSWKLNEITTSSPSPPPSVTAADPRAPPSTPSFSTQLLNFKRGIKRDISAYPTLKDEKYYESFKRSVLVTARAHDCEEILQPTFRPRGDADSLELFRLKNDFMYSVFNKCLLSDMGKTIVRKHLDHMNAQRVWEEFATHMTTSSKGKAEKRRLHSYVTTTVLDKSWKGTTEQFILHFNEQFRQLDEASPPEESLPFTTRLTLLQAAVHNIPELRMVETMEEFISLSSSTPGPTMGYDNYLTLLQNACIRYDSNLKSRPSPASRAAYQHELSHDQHDTPYPQDYSSSGTTYGGIDMPAEEFYQVHTTNLNRPPNVSTITPRKPTSSHPPGRPTPRRSPGPIFLPANIYKLLSDVAIKELKKHNATTRSTPSPKKMFPGESLPQVKSPLDKNDHPELDNSELASDDLITKFMCMVGQLQWAVTLGRYDILAHVMSMSRFRLAPKVGHIERMKRIYGYLSWTKHYALRFRTAEPNYMHLPDLEYDWTRIYGHVFEQIPKDAPEPLGKSVTTTTFLDANLLHDLITGRSVTAVLHFFNLTPGDWYSKRQATVENATYGSEFVAAKTATEQIIDIRQTLRYLGVPIKSKAYMFGDNKSVVTSSTVPHSLLSKRHNILSYHRVREAIAAKILVTGVIPPRTKVIFSVSTGNFPRFFTSSETSLTSKERYHSSSRCTGV